MLTQIQTSEPQAALLAACPRPRAVAPSVPMPLMPSSSPAWVGVVRLGAVAEERSRAFGGFAAPGTRGFGYAAASRVVAAGTVGNGNEIASRKQDKQHLTSRRGPFTWRPPH